MTSSTSSTSATANIVQQLGSGSGINISSLVGALVNAQIQPQLDSITKQQTADQATLSGLGTLQSSLLTFQTAVLNLNNPFLFQTTQISSSNSAVVTATTGLGSIPGNNTVEVDQLASTQQSIGSTEYASSSAVVSAAGGTFNFNYPSGSTQPGFSVNVPANATLQDIANAINGASDNNNVAASIVNVDSTVPPGTTVSKLVLSSTTTGVANGFTVAVSSGDAAGTGLNQLDSSTPANYAANFDATNSKVATDAKIKVDGLSVTSGSNTVTNVLPGITLTLQSAAVGTTVNLNTSLNTTAITNTINSFVTAYNTLTTSTHSLGAFGGTASGATNGPLLGNSTLRSIAGQLRHDVSAPVSSASGSYNSLMSLGISIDSSGVMSLDSTTLNTALSSNLSSAEAVFSSSKGVASVLSNDLFDALQSGGGLDSQQTTLTKEIAKLKDQTKDVNTTMAHLQSTLQAQFVAMDNIVGKYKSTATFLTSNFASSSSSSSSTS